MLRLVRNRVSAWWINVSSATPTTLLHEADQHQHAWGLVTSGTMVGSLTWMLRQSPAVLIRKTMNLQKAIEIAGSKSKLATLLGVSRAAVTQWDELPEKRINQLKGIEEWQTHFSGAQDKVPSESNSSASATSQQ
jgi:hypothetical protein